MNFNSNVNMKEGGVSPAFQIHTSAGNLLWKFISFIISKYAQVLCEPVICARARQDISRWRVEINAS